MLLSTHSCISSKRGPRLPWEDRQEKSVVFVGKIKIFVGEIKLKQLRIVSTI